MQKLCLLVAVLFSIALNASSVTAAEESPHARFDAQIATADPAQIRIAAEEYAKLDASDPEVAWRLLFAYYSYYDELAERDRKKDQTWAVDLGHLLAKEAVARHPDDARVVYYAAGVQLGYMNVYRMKAVFILGNTMNLLRRARELDPTIDDWGPDRGLGILYHVLPGWPVSSGDQAKAYEHLSVAAKNAPDRAVNRHMFAKNLIALKRYEEAQEHVDFLQAGKWRVTSEHWRRITSAEVAETAKALTKARQ
jgi:tetratricopeptide (TPR) repeat protein